MTWISLSFVTGAHLPFKVCYDFAGWIGQTEVQSRRDNQRFSHTIGRSLDRIDRRHDILYPDRVADGRLLDDRDELIRDRRENILDRLRQNYKPHGFGAGKAKRPGGFRLPEVDRLNTGADNLRQIGAGVQGQGNHSREEPVKADKPKKLEAGQDLYAVKQNIENNKEEIQNNSEKINILNEKCQNLKKMAKDIYDIKQFEAVEKIKQKSKEKKEKIQRKIREYEINVHSMQSGLNKLRTKLEQNKRNIEILEEEKNILIEKYKDKQIEFKKVKNKIIRYNTIKINGKQLNYEDNSTNNSRNNYNIKNIKLNINIEESPKVYELIEEHKNINNKRNNQVLNSSGPSVISLTKEKSNFGDINDIQLLNPIENPKENDNNEKEKGKKNFQVNQIDKDININIIGENNKKNQSNEINKKEQEKTKIINNNDKTLSKEMILKGLDSQEKTDNILIYSSRNIQNKNNKGTIDRRNLLKLNFSFTSPSKDNRLNRSLNTLPNERNMLNYEIEEDIVLDSNSANNVNINSKEKRFNTKIEDIKISQDKIDNNLKNNTSIEIDKNFVKNEYDNQEKESYGKKEEKYEKDNDKRENVLNTILYNEVDNKTKNEKFMENLNNNNENNLNNEEEQINKSFEEEHIFDKKENEDNNKKEDEKENEKKKEKEKEETDSVNYDFEDGDNIIEVDYEKI